MQTFTIFPCCDRYTGQINTTDFFTRLLCGIAYTGIAPDSFYTSANGSRPHFDGTPVDVVSGMIAATVAHERSGFANYHVVNPHYSDGISLDTIAAWLASTGIKVRVADRLDEFQKTQRLLQRDYHAES